MYIVLQMRQATGVGSASHRPVISLPGQDSSGVHGQEPVKAMDCCNPPDTEPPFALPYSRLKLSIKLFVNKSN
jgi:hypothetical protein